MIIVFGSLNIDMVMSVQSMPRPGETVLCPDYRLIPGGKGANQAVAASRAGAQAKMFGKIGDDEFGRIVLKSLKEAQVDVVGVNTTDSPTGCATVCVDANGENMIMVASGANRFADQEEIPNFLLNPKTTLLLQLETPPEENWSLIERARKAGAKSILNLAPAHEIPGSVLKNIDYLVLNQIEASVLALHLGFDVISPSIAARRISSSFGLTCVVTLGAEGALACAPDGIWSVQAMEVEAVDTTAAGDAFVGVFAASLDGGEDLPSALRKASVASGLACTEIGAQSSLPDAEKIAEALYRVPMPKRIA